MKEKTYVLTSEQIADYAASLREQERSDNTIQQYIRSLSELFIWLDGRKMAKRELIAWKMQLTKKYAAATVNTMLAAINGFLRFMRWNDVIIKLLKIQKTLFRDEEQELSYEEYARLVKTAEHRKDKRLALVLQTICATGIRVSELKFITVEAVRKGKTEVFNKGKRRVIFLPESLSRILQKYVQKQGITSGPVFVTRSGKPLDRSNIWRDMKRLCEEAGVSSAKVFPHNLRHLFARMFYALEKDTYRLADILGHVNVNTTRIYTAESGWMHVKQMERLRLVLTT